jgi:hypothetical protein
MIWKIFRSMQIYNIWIGNLVQNIDCAGQGGMWDETDGEDDRKDISTER